MKVLLIASDLATSSKVTAAAQAAGASLTLAMHANGLAQRAEGCQLVLLDLTMPGAAPNAVANELAGLSPPPRLIAFGPHVHEERLRAASEAGFLALPRGQFFAQVDDLLTNGGD